MKKALRVSLLMLGVATSSATLAVQVDTEAVAEAQGQMISRVQAEMDAYAKRLRMDPSIVTYCNGERHLHTYQYPLNGQLPFGIIYNQIKDSERLEQVLRVREAYDSWFLRLCITNAKLTIERASR